MKKLTRIRYKVIGSKIESVQEFLGNDGVLLKVSIDVPTSTVNVLRLNDDETTEVVSSRTCMSVGKCKVAAKELLKEVGVMFFDECRKGKLTEEVV